MNRKLIALLSLAACAAFPASAETWTNALGNNDFANWGNWVLDGTSTNPTSWTAASQNWQVNLAGAGRAVVGPGQTVAGVTRNVLVGDGEYAKANSLPTGQVGELLVDGGTLGISRNLRVGRDTDTGSGTVTVDNGGTLDIGYQLTVGPNANAGSTFNLVSGTVNVSPGRSDGITIASSAGGKGTLNISGGQLNVKGGNAAFADGGTSADPASAALNLSGSGALNLETSSGRFGFGEGGTVAVTITGGTFNAPNGYVTFGQGAGSNVAVTISGGTINADRVNWGNAADGTATLAMTGGTFNAVRSGASTSSTTGGFVMGVGNSVLDVGGTAAINAEKLYFAAGGLLTISGEAAINISGSTDGVNPTFNIAPAFQSGDWSTVLGKVAINGGTLRVAGATDPVFLTVNYAALLNAAIERGVIYTTVDGATLKAQYQASGNFTEIVLETSAPVSFWADYPDSGGFKLTEVAGWLYDPHFPWIYVVEMAAWIYALPEGGSADAFFAWSPAEQGWLYFNVQYDGWYWSYRDAAWKR